MPGSVASGTLCIIVSVMHAHTNTKFISAKQAKGIQSYKNTKRRLYGTIAAIWYNKICRDKQLSPNYIAIKINGSNRQLYRVTIKEIDNFNVVLERNY